VDHLTKPFFEIEIKSFLKGRIHNFYLAITLPAKHNSCTGCDATMVTAAVAIDCYKTSRVTNKVTLHDISPLTNNYIPVAHQNETLTKGSRSTVCSNP